MSDKTYSELKRDNELLSTANTLLEKMMLALRIDRDQLADALVMWTDSWRESLAKGEIPRSSHWSMEDMVRGDEAVRLAHGIVAIREKTDG